MECPECPTCGRDDFSSIRYLRLHHIHKHNSSIAHTTNICEYCEEEYVVFKHEEDERRYCSKRCYYNSDRDRRKYDCLDCDRPMQEQGEGVWSDDRRFFRQFFECPECDNEGYVTTHYSPRHISIMGISAPKFIHIPEEHREEGHNKIQL